MYVAQWERFQQYHTGKNHKDTQLIWIRCYTELLDKDEYLNLSAADRALLHAVWMATGKLGNGRLPAGVVSLRRRFRLRHVALDRLIHAGFLTVRPTKNPRTEQSRAEEEKNLQFELPQDPKVDGANAPTQRVPVVADADTDPGDEFTFHADRLLEACRAPMYGSERLKLLGLRAEGASVAAIASARERVLTKRGPMRNPFGLAVAVIRAESGLPA